MKRFVFALLFTCVPAFILPKIAQAQHSEDTALVRPGVVVDQVAKNSEAEKAGLREGDVVLAWTYKNFENQIKSPLDLYDLEAVQRTRGPVRLHGLRHANNANGPWERAYGESKGNPSQA